MPTRCPYSKPTTSSATATTWPTTSCPGTVSGDFGARSPSARCRSVRHTAHTRTRTRISPRLSCGTGSVVRRRGWPVAGPGSWTTHAAMSSGRSCRTGTEASIALTISARRPGYADRVAKDSSKNTDVRQRMPRKPYEKELFRLQAELVNLQEWVHTEGERLVVVFEGRDAAGKAAPSSGSPSISTRGLHGSWRCPPHRKAARPVVFPALCRAVAGCGRDRALRPKLVQPGRRGAGHGLLH